MPYDAFVSYSHAADGRLAPAIQSGLRRMARPWYRLYALRIFRDSTSLSASPELWPRIENGLKQSSALILLASSGSAQSRWVRREVTYWRTEKGNAPLYIVLTEGELQWDEGQGKFDPEQSSALPEPLHSAFHSEPLWVDFRWARNETDLSLRNPRFADGIATLAAALHGKDKDILIGDDVRQHHRTWRLVIATLMVLIALLGATFWFFQSSQRQLARATENFANSIAANILSSADGHDLELLTAIATTRIANTWQTRSALLQVLQHNRQVRRLIYPSDQSSGPFTIAVSPGGEVATRNYYSSAELFDVQGKVIEHSTDVIYAFAGDKLLKLDRTDSLVLDDGSNTYTLPFEADSVFAEMGYFVSDLKGKVIAFAFDDGMNSRLAVCSITSPPVCHRSRPLRERPAVIALSEDGKLVSALWNSRNGAEMELFRTSDLETTGNTGRLNEEAVAVSSDSSGFRVLLASGAEAFVPKRTTASGPSLDIPKPRFSSSMVSAAAGDLVVFAEAWSGIGLPPEVVDPTIILLDRTMPQNGNLSRSYAPEARILAINGRGETASRSCDLSQTCPISIGKTELSGPLSEVTASAFNSDGDLFLAGVRGGRVLAWNVKDGSRSGEWVVDGSVTKIDAAARDRALVTSGTSAALIDLRKSGTIQKLNLAMKPDVVAMTSAAEVFVVYNRMVFRYDLKKGVTIPLTISQDELPIRADGDDGEAELMTVSPDGRYMATVSNVLGEGITPRILIRNLAGNAARPLLIDAGVTNIPAVSVGTTLVAAATTDGIRLWTRETGQSASAPFKTLDEVQRLELLRNDELLVIYYQNGMVETITLALSDLQRIACELAHRDLSVDEWQRRLPNVPYERTCQTILGRSLPDHR